MSEETGQILVVDDNRVNRLKLSLSLEGQGHQVALAEDGQQALDLLKQQTFDVVLLDIVMPGIDGFQVLEKMKADPELRDIPVIVISALDEIDSAVRCIEVGAEDYLPKPFNPVLLRARLHASLQKKKLPRSGKGVPAPGSDPAAEREACDSRQAQRRHGARAEQSSRRGTTRCSPASRRYRRP